ncbi:LacI family DNA-binding transcriptional regulator [Falsirhodobacter sp. alg1]|uniref:LacI family DNA-binding transcriptional regulator n=1 Tax=Falsirhodobacter sp. alg1 TaxID=1472418 RepID=UPI0005EE871E|nr:LacI family DNA-binding transcriptional regulator [Falsirhodobacter sp. alg1]
MPPRLIDIATSLGVSAATVSNVLSGKGRVSPELADQIRSEAERRGYAPGGPGRALRTGRSGVLGLVLPDLSNPLFPRMAQALEHESAAVGYGMLIADSHGNARNQQGAIARLLKSGADGIILVPRRGAQLEDCAAPLVIIDTPSSPDNTVSADHYQGGTLIVGHLTRFNHRSLVFVGESNLSGVQRDRIAGMRDALPSYCTARTVWLEQEGPAAVVAAVKQGATAIAATSDLVALRLLAVLEDAKIAVPQQVSLSGFDDLIFASVMRPTLTTVIADEFAIARNAIKALIAQIEGTDHLPPSAIPMTLIPRTSTTGTP